LRILDAFFSEARKSTMAGAFFDCVLVRSMIWGLEKRFLTRSPPQNGYAESFHSRLRDEFLAREVFESLAAAHTLTAAWREDYNDVRPHGSLGYLTPAEFAVRGAPSAPAGRRACAAGAPRTFPSIVQEP
jgi:Integrase core domain